MSDLEDLLDSQLRSLGYGPYEREVAFAKEAMGRRWRADFVFPKHRLIVEVDGGSWSGGRHTTGAGFEADCEKLNAAALLGYRVLRFTGKHIRSGYAFATIKEALSERA